MICVHLWSATLHTERAFGEAKRATVHLIRKPEFDSARLAREREGAGETEAANFSICAPLRRRTIIG